MEFLSESMEICLESSWSISQWNTKGIPFNINGTWSGKLLVDFPKKSSRTSFRYQRKIVWRESLWNSFQNQWKLVWRALGQFPNGILMEFLSISMEIGLERILMEFLSNPYGIPFNYNGNLSVENPYGIPYKINENWSGELLVNFPDGVLKEFPSISMEIALESSWSMFIWNPYGTLF